MTRTPNVLFRLNGPAPPMFRQWGVTRPHRRQWIESHRWGILGIGGDPSVEESSMMTAEGSGGKPGAFHDGVKQTPTTRIVTGRRRRTTTAPSAEGAGRGVYR
jgi:hypothetical protein